MNKQQKQGFSLMEMMIVLLIMSIIAAATAPIVSKKMSKSNGGASSSPWVFIDTKGNAAFNMGGKEVTAVIGASKVPSGVKTRLYIDCGDDTAQITLGKGDQAASITADPVNGRIGISSSSSAQNIPNNSVALGTNQSLMGTNIVAIGDGAQTNGNYTSAIGSGAYASGTSSIAVGKSNASGDYSIAIGEDAKAEKLGSISIGKLSGSNGNGRHGISLGATMGTGDISIAIGLTAKATGTGSTAIGHNAEALLDSSIAMGENAKASAPNTIAIGNCSDVINYTRATQRGAVAIGYNVQSTNDNSIALGNNTRATHGHSTAIGFGAKTTNSNQIVLGTSADTVYIPGNLVVGQSTYLGADKYNMSQNASPLYVRFKLNPSAEMCQIREVAGNNDNLYRYGNFSVNYSDRRLKNVGEKYTDGLEALKKLDFYHFTFKKDESKTPHVGIMAQDLQKVFPDAVTKGEDGFLRIRMEDMFYAVINAVKELDKKFTTLEKQNAELKAQNQDLIKRIEKLEKSKKF